MPVYVAAALILAELLLLGGIVLGLHRLSPRYGLSPLLIFLGTLTAALQLWFPGVFLIQNGDFNLTLAQGSFLILPVLLLGLLIIYIVNGTSQARAAMMGIALVTVIIFLIQTLPSFVTELSGSNIFVEVLPSNSPKALFVSALTLILDMLVLITVYQWISNLRQRFPSRLAAGLALLAAVWSDALVFPLLAILGLSIQASGLGIHLAGKSLAVLALWPLLSLYISSAVVQLPHSAASYPRPTLDIFSTAQQHEARGRYHYGLLRTLSQINQLILRTDDPQKLLEQASRQLTNSRDYLGISVGIIEPGDMQVHLRAQAGKEINPSANGPSQDGDLFALLTPVNQAVEDQTAVISKDIQGDDAFRKFQPIAREHDMHSMAIFPMRHAGKPLGVMVIYSKLLEAFDQEEINLLQELADDLAYALTSLEAHRQQALLQTAAETMQDGMLIIDSNGLIVYANPAFVRLVGQPLSEILGEQYLEWVPTQGGRQQIQKQYQKLLTEKKVTFEYEHFGIDGSTQNYSINASQVDGTGNSAGYIVVSVSDTTPQHQYEHQLLAVNNFMTEMIRTHEIRDLVDKVFRSGEALLQAWACAIYLLAPDGKTVSEVYFKNVADDLPQRVADDYQGLPEEAAWNTSRPIAITSTSEHPEYGERINIFADFSIQSMLILPVIFTDETMGALSFYYPESHTFTDKDLELGQTLARTLAITIKNMRLFQAEYNQRRFAEALGGAAVALNSSLDLDEVLDRILDQTLSVTGCRSVNIMLNEGDQSWVVRNLDRLAPDKHGLSPTRQLALSTPTLQNMLETREAVVIPDTYADLAWQMLDTSPWIASYAGAPLCVQNEVLGFLNMNSDQANFFSHDIIPRLQAFAATAAAAIQNARLFSDLQAYSSELEERVSERTLELSSAKERIESILKAVPDAVYVLDEQYRLVQANPAGENLLATAEQEGLDLFASEFLNPLIEGSLPEEKAILEVGGRASQALASPVPNPDSPSGFVVVFRDVTRFRELDRMKTRFVSDVSHELRTPLANLSIYLDLLSTVEDERRSREYLATLQRETGRLTHLIEDLLTISRLEAGRIVIEIQPVDVVDLVQNLAQDRAPMAAQQKLTISHSTAPGLPQAYADPRLLSQVLSNLLTNAFNYTQPQGAIHLHTDMVQSMEQSWITISIQDTGVGILPGEMDNLFVRFFRGSASDTTASSGTGLGLSISKEIIDRLDGRITVESQPGQGSNFIVWLKAVL